jgi:hypothetical protein
MANNGIKPKQRVSNTEKQTKSWKENNIWYYSDACKDAIDPIEATKLYNLANGSLNPEDYTFVTNPLNTRKRELTGYPGELKNYDIISPNLMSLLGDKKARNFPPIVVARNSDYADVQKEKITQETIRTLHGTFINEAIALGMPMTEEIVATKLEEIQKKVKNIPDALAAQGQDSLDYIRDYNDLTRNFRKGFYDFMVTAMAFTYRDVIEDETYHEIISPNNSGYLAADHSDFVEDGEAFRAKYFMNPNEVYDRLQGMDGFDDTVKAYLDTYSNYSSDSSAKEYYSGSDAISAQHKLFDKLGINTTLPNIDGVSLEHIVWRSQVEYGHLLVPTLTGVEKIKVTRDYKPLEGEEITWKWEDQIWEGYYLDSRFVIGVRPIPTLSGEKVKLPYNGRVFISRVGTPQSICKKGEPYQKSVNIIRYMMERTISKNMDKIMVFPIGLIPDKEGWDEKTVMYYAQALSFLFVDETKENFKAAIDGLKGIDMSLSQYIIESVRIVDALRAEWDEVSGISPQRKANVGTSAGKGTTEIAIDRSFVISEELFTEYEELEQRDYTTLLQLSKYAFSEGKQAHFVRDGKELAFLNIDDPDAYADTEFNVFVKNNKEELEKLRALRNQATAFAQNAVKPSIIGKILQDNNMSKLVTVMEEMEDEMQAQQQAAAKQEQESNERIAQTVAQDKAEEREFKYYKVDADNANDLEVALIQDTQTIIKQEVEGGTSNEDNSGLAEDRMNRVQDNLLELLKLRTKKDEIASKERMNKENNKTALKNKVVGEGK